MARLLALALTPAAAGLNVSTPQTCRAAVDVCGCSELAPGCGWCSSSRTCEPSDRCTTTCRECPSGHTTCRKACRRRCVDTCALVGTSCACTELDGCGWCSHQGASGGCAPYPDCSTTCDECNPACSNHLHCVAKCFKRFRPQRKVENPEGQLFPLARKDINCALAVCAATILASAAGIGGGAVLVPLFTLLGEFTEHEAIPLSIATVFGASAFSTLGNFLWLKHPLVPHRQLIAYDVVSALLPATLLGSTVGVFLNKLCPNWLIMVLLVSLCAFSGYRTVQQGFKRRAKESKEAAGGYAAVAMGEHEEHVHDDTVEMHDMLSPVQDTKLQASTSARLDGPSSRPGHIYAHHLQVEIEAEIAREARFPFGTLLMLCRTWLVVMGLSLLKGGHGAPSLIGIKCGTPGYWAVVLLNFPVLGGLGILIGRDLVRQHLRKVEMGYSYVDGDVQWDTDKVRLYPRVVAVGAVAAGLLGVGGGMILGPIFNELEFLPQVSSATSTIMVFFMSSATVGQFVIFGMLDMKYASFYGAVGVVGAIIGTKGAKVLIEKTGRASFLIFFLAIVLFGSGVLMAATGVPLIMQTGMTGFRPLCGRAGAAARVD
ncbi:hypothetical protein AB1Y20_019174 [Prymnesium parvum]|uniref:Sulfite exporter TauE/SafE n=1 Tax=Prymnesium parvum TaxID=97485 RepID=A0AB34JQN5_PRYPA